MSNYNKVLDAQKVALGSAGLAVERYDIYMQGLEATTNRFTAQWEKMWSSAISSKSIKFVINLGTFILKLVDALGLLNLAFVAAFGYLGSKGLVVFPALTSQIISFIGVTGTATAVTTALNIALGGIVALAGVVLVAAIYKATRGVENLYESFKKSTDLFEAQNKELRDLRAEYDALASKEEKSKEDKVRLLDIQDLLTKKYHLTAQGVDFYTDAINNNTEAIKANNAEMMKREVSDAKKYIEENKKAYEEAKKYLETPLPIGSGGGGRVIPIGVNARTPEERIDELSRRIILEGDALGLLGAEKDRLEQRKGLMEDIIAQYEHYVNVLTMGEKSEAGTSTWEKIMNGAMAIQTARASVEDWNTAIDANVTALRAEYDEMVKILDSYEQYGQVTMEDVDALKKRFPEDYFKLLYVEGDQIKLNTEAYKELVIAKAKAAYETALLASAMYPENEELKKQVEILKAYYEQIKSGEGLTKKTAEQQKKAYDDLLKDVLDMIKDRTNAEKDALQKELQAFKDAMDAKKQALQDTADAQKQALQDELDGYKSIIDAQKRLIDLKKAEADQADAVATKNKEISDIDAQLLALQFDNSQEANAQRLKLENDRAIKVKELSTMQNDYSVNNQKDALDQEYALFEKENKAKQSTIDKTLKAQLSAIDKEYKAFEININNKIAELDAYLNQSGTMTQDAINLLKTQSASFFVELINWNKAFGTSVDTDITDKWKTAFGEMGKYIDAYLLARDMGAFDIGNYYQGSGGAGDGSYYDPSTHTVITPHHSGGFVGDKPVLKNDEEFAKLVKGELVVTSNTMGNFMKNILPNLVGGAVGTIGNISMNFVVQGSLDKSVIPELKDTIIQAVNNVLKDRGVRRNAFSYSV